MKNFPTSAFACAVLVPASSAYATPLPSEGDYEWRIPMQQRPGPRATLLALERVWVATSASMGRMDDRIRMMATRDDADAASCMSHRAA